VLAYKVLLIYILLFDCLVFFFFSSRRRHTRFSRDWSSDVCSSDLAGAGRVLSESSTAAMRQRTSRQGVLENGYGIGWNIREVGGATIVGHGGATNGFRATLATIPERGFALAMLTNGDPGTTSLEHI